MDCVFNYSRLLVSPSSFLYYISLDFLCRIIFLQWVYDKRMFEGVCPDNKELLRHIIY